MKGVGEVFEEREGWVLGNREREVLELVVRQRDMLGKEVSKYREGREGDGDAY